jgi:tRNA dimethylallyltransferase
VEKKKIIAVIGPTASGKSARAVALAKELDSEVISVDSRQVYRTLDIGTEKTSVEEMGGVRHHLIDIRDPEEVYSAGDFVHDASEVISLLHADGKVPVLAGGTHFYFDALLYGLPGEEINWPLRAELEKRSTEDLFAELTAKDPRRAAGVDPVNRRRLLRALEIVAARGFVPERTATESAYDIEWVVIELPKDELRERIDARLQKALDRGLIDEVRRTQERVGDTRLDELGLEYRIIGEYLRGELPDVELLPRLSSKLWRYAKTQKRWLDRLTK